MRLFLRALAAISLSFIAGSASASATDPKSGFDYLTLSQPQPTELGKKIEVIEFFGYFCPHCNAFDSALTEWVKKQGANIIFKRVEVNFRGEPQQRLYYTLEVMGKLEEMHKKIFNAIHVERQSLLEEPEIVDFVVKQGIDKQKFLDIYNSFSVVSKINRAVQLQTAYKIESVPTIAIGGRYITSPSIAGAGMPPNTSEVALGINAAKVMDVLVDKAQKAQGVQAVLETPATPAAPASQKKKAKK